MYFETSYKIKLIKVDDRDPACMNEKKLKIKLMKKVCLQVFQQKWKKP